MQRKQRPSFPGRRKHRLGGEGSSSSLLWGMNTIQICGYCGKGTSCSINTWIKSKVKPWGMIKEEKIFPFGCCKNGESELCKLRLQFSIEPRLFKLLKHRMQDLESILPQQPVSLWWFLWRGIAVTSIELLKDEARTCVRVEGRTPGQGTLWWEGTSTARSEVVRTRSGVPAWKNETKRRQKKLHLREMAKDEWVKQVFRRDGQWVD